MRVVQDYHSLNIFLFSYLNSVSVFEAICYQFSLNKIRKLVKIKKFANF